MRRTRKHSKGQYSIPELRRSFEYIEKYVDTKIQSKETHNNIVKHLRKEWKRVFSKELNKRSAEAFVEDRSKFKRNTLRKRGGMAPIDYALRPGVYLAPGQIPMAGHLPTSGLVPSDFGNYTEYIDKGFFNPNIAQSYDPLSYQTRFPTSVPEGMGSNLVKGGRRTRRARKTRRGGGVGALLSEAFQRPIPASSPPAILQDMQSMWNGTATGPSSDQVQRQPVYVR